MLKAIFRKSTKAKRGRIFGSGIGPATVEGNPNEVPAAEERTGPAEKYNGPRLMGCSRSIGDADAQTGNWAPGDHRLDLRARPLTERSPVRELIRRGGISLGYCAIILTTFAACNILIINNKSVVPPTGLEPVTPALRISGLGPRGGRTPPAGA